MNVSVIIPVYNAEAYVESAVRSALQQPETGEVLLIEDASPDGSLAICERLAREHAKVRLLRHPNGENRGAGASRNVGIRAARCDLVAFLDADDYYLPGRFERAVSMLAADETLDGVYEAVGTHFESDEMREWWLEARGNDELTTLPEPVAPEDLFEALVWGVNGKYGNFHTNGIVVHRSLFERCGLFTPALRMCQDLLLWRQMALVGRLAAGRLTEPVAMRRLHGENRIVKDRAIHVRYQQMVHWTLLAWCEREGVGEQQCRTVLKKMLWRRLFVPRDHESRPARVLRDVAYHVRLLVRSRTARRSREAYRSFAHALGWKRLRRIAGRIKAAAIAPMAR